MLNPNRKIIEINDECIKKSKKSKKSYTLVYRTGGTENFKWHKLFTTFDNYDDALKERKEIERGGYPCLIHDTDLLNAIGMPETYDVKEIINV